MDPKTRLQRLRTDQDRLQELANRSPYVDILESRGNPPDFYKLRLTCRGVQRLDDAARPVYSESHIVEVSLGPEYPFQAPEPWYRSLPIYHPNISDRGKMCVNPGAWEPGGTFLDGFVRYLMDMIRYKEFTNDAYNPDAFRWASTHRDLVPVDSRPLFPEAVVRRRDTSGSAAPIVRRRGAS